MKLLLLKKEGESIPVKQKIKVIGNLNNFADNDISFEEHTTLKGLFGSLTKALKESEFIVIAVSSDIYNKTKIKLMAALSLKTAEDGELVNKLSSLGLDEDAVRNNALMPENADIFYSADGVCSGFAVKKGKQQIAVIPLDDNYTDTVIKRGLVPYLTGGSAPKPAPAPKEEAKEETGESKPEYNFTDNEKAVAVRTLNILRENDIKIAVNGNANSNVLRSIGENLEDFNDYFTFTPHIEDRGDYNVTDYTAQMARSAKGLSNADFGACISDIFSNDECDYICISVATDKSALVRKLYKEENETDDRFIAGAAEELFALISEKVTGNGAVGIEIAQDEAPNKTKTGKGKKILLAVLSVILVAAAVVAALYFIKNKTAEPETTTEATTEITTAEPETTTEAPVKLEDMVLSDFIRYEMVNGIQKPEDNTPAETTTVGAIDSEETTTEPVTERSNGLPSVITVNGTDIEAKEAIARIVEAEMSKDFSTEAIKAQAVVTYTYLKYRNTGWVVDGLKLADAYSQEVYDAVSDVYGKYLMVSNSNPVPAFTPFTYMSAGKTASSELIFGVKFDYLGGVNSASDTKRDGYKVDTLLTAEDIKTAAKAYDETINFGEDVGAWLAIKSHDTAVSNDVGYVQTIAVGDREISGLEFIYGMMKEKGLASTCFSLSFDAENNAFTVTTYGKGHGVGMSQTGADRLAIGGAKYGKILTTYYPTTIVISDNA